MSDIHLSHGSNRVYWFVMHNSLFNCCFIDLIMLCYCSNVCLMIASVSIVILDDLCAYTFMVVHVFEIRLDLMIGRSEFDEIWMIVYWNHRQKAWKVSTRSNKVWWQNLDFGFWPR